jgi:hypothetical protein
MIIGEKNLGDFIETKAKKSPTSPGLVSPDLGYFSRKGNVTPEKN